MKIGNLEVYGVIYKITNKVNGKVYIGQTTKCFEQRYCYRGKIDIERIYNTHLGLKKASGYYNKHLVSAISKYGVESFLVNKCLDVAFSKTELDIKEKVYIKIYNSFIGGYNKTEGGGGNSGCVRATGSDSPSSKSVIQLGLDGSFIKEWGSMIEASNVLSVSGTDISSICNNKESKQGYSRKSVGGFIWVLKEDYTPNTHKYINKTGEYNKIKIVQLSLNGDFIGVFDSISEASRNVEGSSVSKISLVCKGERNSHNNYMWMYYDDYIENGARAYKSLHNGKKKKVNQFTLDGEYIATYNSITEASISVSGNNSKICSCCKHNKKTAYGFKWEYEITI